MSYTVISTTPPAYDHTGWCEHTGLTCHSTLQAYTGGLGVESLDYVRNDCLEAAKYRSRKTNHYIDTALYIGQRITKMEAAAQD